MTSLSGYIQCLPYLKVEAEQLSEMSEVFLRLREELHEPHCEVEQTSSLPVDHHLVLLLRGTGEVVPPVDLHALPTVELQHLLTEDCDGLRVSQLQDLLQADEHDVGGAVYGAGLSIDEVSTWLSSPQDGAVLDIVYQQAGVMEHLDDFLDISDLFLRDIQPQVEAGYEFVPDVFAGNFDDVTVRLQQESFLSG